MIKYTELEPGKKYEFGGINVGKFISRNDNILIFENSEFGERNENEIDAVEEDDFIEIKRQKSVRPKSRKRNGGERERERNGKGKRERERERKGDKKSNNTRKKYTFHRKRNSYN